MFKTSSAVAPTSISPVGILGLFVPAGRWRTLPVMLTTHSLRRAEAWSKSSSLGKSDGSKTVLGAASRSRMSMKMRPPRSRREWTQPDRVTVQPDVRRAQLVAMMRAFHEFKQCQLFHPTTMETSGNSGSKEAGIQRKFGAVTKWTYFSQRTRVDKPGGSDYHRAGDFVCGNAGIFQARAQGQGQRVKVQSSLPRQDLVRKNRSRRIPRTFRAGRARRDPS